MKPALFLILILALSLCAQELPPELAGPAGRHQQQTAALAGQKATAMARALQPYLAALDTAEKVATTAAQLSAIAAITKEREEAAKGPMASVFPAELPKNLQSPRRAVLQTTAQIRADFSARQKKLDGEYLRVLAGLAPKAAGNAALAEQIAAEKKRILDRAAADAASEGVAGTRWSMPASYVGAREAEAWIEFEPNGDVLVGWRKPAEKGSWKLDRDGKVMIEIWKDKSIVETIIPDPDRKEGTYMPRNGGAMRIRRLSP